MRIAALTIGLILGLVITANAQNYTRAWVRARAYGNTQAMNRIITNASNPYSSIQRRSVNRPSFRYQQPLNIYPERGRYTYKGRRTVRTNLDRPLRYRLRSRNGYQRQLNVYVPGRR